MFEIVTGQKTNVLAVSELVGALQALPLTGTLYIGYPILATADDAVVIDALLTCEEHGVVLFDLRGERALTATQLIDEQNDLHAALHQKLLAYKPLREGRGLAIEVQVVTLLPSGAVPPTPGAQGPLAAVPSALPELVKTFAPITEHQLALVNAAIQRITTMKPANRRQGVRRADSRGAVMQQIERAIANLDQWQKRAAIESPEGPQRIRGLAGSGKTVVLALKAAYLHARNPDWDIAVTFHTRALRQQFTDLIRRFCFEHMNDEPNWKKLRVLHSWGSQSGPGICSEIAAKYGVSVRNLASAKQAYGYDRMFEGVCEEILGTVSTSAVRYELFDAILIDEAQDLPRAFFELCYSVTREPKRIVWAYDELQNLSSYMMAAPQDLFGKDAAGVPRVANLSSGEGEPRRDIILPVCYRNTPWALTTAHAVGFGVYRKEGLVQYFDDAELWADVGYRVVSGQLEYGADVVLARSENSYPEYFSELLDPSDAVLTKAFPDADAQAAWVAMEVAKNITEEELDVTDILIILSNPLTAAKDAGRVAEALNAHSIPSHLAGVTASADQLFQEGSVAMSGIYRAKGNEAPMVYILDADYCSAEGFGYIRRRNILFTGITRSRAWVRVLGSGEGMERLQEEIATVRDHDYRLAFRVPTKEQLRQLRKIRRDMSRQERETIRSAKRGIDELFELIMTGRIDREQIPADLLEKMATLLKEQGQ